MPTVKELIKSEFVKCSFEPIHFMKKYCKVQHPTKGKINFDLYDFQEKIIDSFHKDRYNIVLKARQLGLSTLVAGYSLHMMLFKPDSLIVIIATTQDTAKNLVTKIRVMHSSLPRWLQGNCTEENKMSMSFSNGSNVKAVSSSPHSIRSNSLSLLVIDEAGFIPSPQEVWTAAQSTIALGGKAIIISTPNGFGGFFHDTWVKAEEGRSEFMPIKLHWSVHPDRDDNWRKEQDELVGERFAKQENDCSFITSGHTVVSGTILEWYKEQQVIEPIEKRTSDMLWIWEPTDYSKSYVITADIARGDGSDYSAFHIFDIEAVKQVAEFRGQIDTTMYGNLLVNMANEYNNALLVVENAGLGWSVIQTILGRDYNNLYYSPKEYIEKYDIDTQIAKGYDYKDKSQMVPGFTTSLRTRPLVVSKIELYMQNKLPIIRSSRLINELFSFVWINGKAIARTGNHDDLVISFGFALWLRDTALKLRSIGIELTKNSLSNITRTTHTGIYKPGYNAQNKWKMNVGKDIEDLTWLINDKNENK